MLKRCFAFLLCTVLHPNLVFTKQLVREKSLQRRDTSSCVLPNHPENGHWSTFNSSSNFIPGHTVSEGTYLNVYCQKKFRLRGSQHTLCENGEWSEPIGDCLKICESIYNSFSMSVTCIRYGISLPNCRNPLEGTIARFKCANFYEDLSLAGRSPLFCNNGKWSRNLPNCEPICGEKTISTTPLLIGGNHTTSGSFPWMAAIYNAKDKELICGGSLINQRMVLTAAHCVTDSDGSQLSVELYQIAVGKYYRKMEDKRDMTNTQFSSVKQIFVPKDYKADIQNYLADLAIIVTKKTFTLSRVVQPVCVDWFQNYDYTLDRSINGSVAGWGFTVEYEKPSEVLKELTVPVVSYSQCLNDLPEDFRKFLTSDKLCAGFLDSNISVCRGDSGGGLVFKYGSRYYIKGIVSNSPQSDTAEGGCDSQQYSLYTKISPYTNFILEKKAQFEGLQSEDEYNPSQINCPFLPQAINGKWNKPNNSTNYFLSCDSDYTLSSFRSISCLKNQWIYNGTGQCLEKITNCESLFDTDTYIISCFFNNIAIPCIDPPAKTVADYQCIDFYENQQLEKHSTRLCRKKSWSVCGKQNINNDFPWHVGIYSASEKKLICAGSLINQQAVITDVNCVREKSSRKYFLPVGSFILGLGKSYEGFSDSRDKNSQFANIEKIFIGGTNLYDLAMLRLSKPVQLSDYVQPICIPWNAENYYNSQQKLLIPGWGFYGAAILNSSKLHNVEIQENIFKDKFKILGDLQNSQINKVDSSYNNTEIWLCDENEGSGLVYKYAGQYYLGGILHNDDLLKGSILYSKCEPLTRFFYLKVLFYVSNIVFPPDALFNSTHFARNVRENESCTIPNFKSCLGLQEVNSFSQGYEVRPSVSFFLMCYKGSTFYCQQKVHCQSNGQWDKGPEICKWRVGTPQT